MKGRRLCVPYKLRYHLLYTQNELMKIRDNGARGTRLLRGERSATRIYGIFSMALQLNRRARHMKKQWSQRMLLMTFPW